MSIIWRLRNWRHLLQGSPYPVIVKTDHVNLQYYQHLQKINQWVACYILILADFNIKLQHLLGTKNHADPLSWQPNYDNGTNDNEQVTALPDELFARVVETIALDQQVWHWQWNNKSQILEWQKQYWDIWNDNKEWWKGHALVVTQPKGIEKDLVEHYHDSNTRGHPGIEWTYQQIIKDYWWPNLWNFVHAYMQGCGMCQQNKTIMQRNNPLIFLISLPETLDPFKVIGVDLIIKLLASRGFNLILTITDQGSTKGVILLPCWEMMGTQELMTLYKEHAFPYIGLPDKLIMDQDVRFMSGLFKELYNQLGVKQNISSAYHPETDSASKWTNQMVETALQIFGNYHQNNWVNWLPILQYQMNAHVLQTTKHTLFDLWMGYTLQAHQVDRPSKMPGIQECKEQLFWARMSAYKAMHQVQESWVKPTKYIPYQKGEKVWLEGTNLKTFYPTTKLHPKWFGPFKITEVLSSTTYHLDLPMTWQIHNVFHGALLLPYIKTTEHGPNDPELPPDIIDGEPKYEVEEIVGSRHRGQGRKLKYCMWYKGYGPAHDSWEPEEHVYAPECMCKFYAQQPTAIKRVWINEENNQTHQSNDVSPWHPWTSLSWVHTDPFSPSMQEGTHQWWLCSPSQKIALLLLRAKDPKVWHAQVCIMAAGLVLQGITGSEHWPLDALVWQVCTHARH